MCIFFFCGGSQWFGQRQQWNRHRAIIHHFMPKNSWISLLCFFAHPLNSNTVEVNLFVFVHFFFVRQTALSHNIVLKIHLLYYNHCDARAVLYLMIDISACALCLVFADTFFFSLVMRLSHRLHSFIVFSSLARQEKILCFDHCSVNHFTCKFLFTPNRNSLLKYNSNHLRPTFLHKLQIQAEEKRTKLHTSRKWSLACVVW